MRSASFLVFLSLLAGCSDHVVGTGQRASAASTSADSTYPAAGEPCACTSSDDQIPTVNCCQGDLVCGGTKGYTCNPSTHTCVRTGTCMTWDQADPAAAPPPSSVDECNPYADTCPYGLSCHLDGSYWRCI